MALNGILKRATSFLGRNNSDQSKPTYENNDIVYCEYFFYFILNDNIKIFLYSWRFWNKE